MHTFRLFVLAIIAVLLLQPVSGNATFAFLQPVAAQEKAQEKDDPSAFTDRVAARLLDQVKEGLEGRMVKKALGSFDLSRMTGGPAFKNQVTAFLNQYETVRIHFNLLETSTTGAEASATVDVEMEENLPGDVSAPVHKHAQLRFVAQNGSKGWKFTDVQPRSFFS
jgi:hypothetical protein